MEALLYPQTYLREDLAETALQVTENLVLLRPAEYPPEGIARKLAEEGRVRFLYPPPLGERLQAFLDLVAGYEEWGLMMRTPENVALFKGFPEPLEESVSDIKRALLGEKAQTDPLLSARLVLALAERLDRKLDLLDRELQDLEEKTRFLSHMIVGEDSPRFERWVIETREPSWKLHALPERMRAWSRLLPVLPALPRTIFVDQPEILEEWKDLGPRKKECKTVANMQLHYFEYPFPAEVLLSLPKEATGLRPDRASPAQSTTEENPPQAVSQQEDESLTSQGEPLPFSRLSPKTTVIFLERH